MGFFGKTIAVGGLTAGIAGTVGGFEALHSANVAATAPHASLTAVQAANTGWLGTFMSGAWHGVTATAQAVGHFFAGAPSALGHAIGVTSGWGHSAGLAVGAHVGIGVGAAGALATVASIALPVAIGLVAFSVAKNLWNKMRFQGMGRMGPPLGPQEGQAQAPGQPAPAQQQAVSRQYDLQSPTNTPARQLTGAGVGYGR